MTFPIHRMRRLRSSKTIRNLFQETRPQASDFILPLFVSETLKKPQAIESMPGVYRHSFSSLIQEAEKAHSLGIQAVLLFGLPKSKDSQATQAYRKDGVIQKAISLLKKNVPTLAVITDVCACEYTSHGHCGIIQGKDVANDPTLKPVSYTHLRAHETGRNLVCRLLLE